MQILAILLIGCVTAVTQLSFAASLYDVNSPLQSRSISFENPTGAPGAGGTAASNLGPGRKGAARKAIAPGETVTLCDIQGPGTINHIWMTGRWGRDHINIRSIVFRAWWDGQEHPSIECPLGDFMGVSHARVTPYESVAHSIGEMAAFNMWLPMPFTKRAKITLENESTSQTMLYYQVDYTLGVNHTDDVGRLHTLFRRENPTTLAQDFELLPRRTGKGRFIGTVMGVRSLHPGWWGEGEVKFYMDGDTTLPTIAGTGSEDYVLLSYGVQETTYTYHGCSLNRDGFINMYRWHILDPIYWKKDCRVTIQQLGLRRGNYYDRDDDWSTATFWYEPVPSAPLPQFPSLEARTANLRPEAAADSTTATQSGRASDRESR
jgi:hypothetical protein